MINKTKIYNLLLNHQEDFLRILEALGVSNPKERIKNLLDEQLFEVFKCTDMEILAIKKKSTGEIFRKGNKIYYREYDTWVENLYFDSHILFGGYLGNTFYQNYVRADGGIYHLNEISLTKKEPKEIPCDETPCEEINLNGNIYVLKNCK